MPFIIIIVEMQHVCRTSLLVMMQRGETSLMSATHSGLSAIVGALINAGADVNQQTKVTIARSVQFNVAHHFNMDDVWRTMCLC